MIHITLKFCSLLLVLAGLLISPGACAQTISTVAGNGTSFLAGNGPSSYLIHDGGPATSASISLPLGVAVDEYGNLFIADFHANSVRKVNAGDGIISTVAGNGTAGSTAGGGLATSTPLNGTTDVAVDASGNLYILDIGNNCIWKVNASDGIIHKIETFTSIFDNEGDITLDAAGNVYYAKANRVMKVNANGPSSIIAGNGTGGYSGDGGLATNALVKNVGGVAVDAGGNIYISGDNRIRKINASNGIIQTIAGNGTAGYSGDGGLAINALLSSGKIILDERGDIYITDSANSRIRKINTNNGIITTIAGNGPGGYISNDGRTGYKGDGGLATEAWLSIPSNIAVDLNQNVYIADVYNYRIRKITNQAGPVITRHPVTTIADAGENAVFTVAAEGSNLTYQWQVDAGTGTYTNIIDSDVYAGATTANLVINQATTAMNGYRYRVLVSNGATTISASAPLTVEKQIADNSGGWHLLGEAGFTPNELHYSAFTVSGGGVPYIAYADEANSYKVTVLKFNGSGWETVGKAGFSAAGAYYNSIAIDAFGTPFIAFADGANVNRLTVMKFDGTSWVTVGTAGFSSGSIDQASLALDVNGTPYVAFVTSSSFPNKATVMKFNGANWVTVGAAGFSAGNAYDISLVLDHIGVPYVAYGDGANANRTTVMKYNGMAWDNVGMPGFGASSTKSSLAIDVNGVPYVAFGIYKNMDDVGKATVMKFNGSNWKTVGSAGFSEGITNGVSLAISTNGTPYAAYSDAATGWKATVKRFDGTSWVNVGTGVISAGMTRFTSMKLGTGGTVFLAYADGTKGLRATVQRFTSDTPVVPTVTGGANCGPGTVMLTANGAADGNFRWYTTSTGRTAIPSAVNATYTTPILSATTTYYVSIVTGITESERTPVTATINPVPAAPTLGTEFTFCQGSTATALSATGNDLKWYTAATGGTSLTTAPIPNTITVGTTNYYVSQTVSGCESERTQVIVVVKALPVISLAAFKEVCSTGSNFPLSGGQPVGGIYSGSGVKNGIFAPGEAGVGTHPITYSYINANGCTSSAVQNITVELCANKDVGAISNFTLSPNPTTGKVKVTSTVQEKTDVVVRILSLDGKIILEKVFLNVEGEFDEVIDLKGMAKGLYLLQNITDKGMVKKRLVIE